MEIRDNYKKDSIYFPENQTHYVNDFTFGIFNDVVEILAKRLNLTFNLYKQEKEVWGDIEKHSNGSIIATGMVSQIYSKKADIIVAPMSLTLSRTSHLAFLHPIGTETLIIVISSKAVAESIDFEVFLKPLHMDLWTTMVLSALVVALAKSFILRKKTSSMIVDSFRGFWSSLMAFFGGSFQSNLSDKASFRIMDLTLLLCGFILWTSYNAFLTSELSVVNHSYPFTDLESLSKSNWRYTYFIILYTYVPGN